VGLSDHLKMRSTHRRTPMNTDSRPWPDKRVTISDSGKSERSCNTQHTHTPLFFFEAHVEQFQDCATGGMLCALAGIAHPVAHSQECHHMLCRRPMYQPSAVQPHCGRY
jgi:hypothetical protein